MKTRKKYLILSAITFFILVCGIVNSGHSKIAEGEDSLKNDRTVDKNELEDSRYQSEMPVDGEYFNDSSLPDSEGVTIIIPSNDKTEAIKVQPLT